MKRSRKFISKHIKKHNSLLRTSKPGETHEPLCYLPEPLVDKILEEDKFLDLLAYPNKSTVKKIICGEESTAIDSVVDLYKSGSGGRNYMTSILEALAGRKINITQMNPYDRAVICNAIFRHRFHLDNGKIFVISDILAHALVNTDITGKCPAMYLRPPFQTTYLHFGFDSNFPLELSENRVLDGVYINHCNIKDPAKNEKIGQCKEALIKANFNVDEIHTIIDMKLLYASHKSKKSVFDIQSTNEVLFIDNENSTVEEILGKNIKYDMIAIKNCTKESNGDYYNTIMHIAKSLLYINTRNKEQLIDSPVEDIQPFCTRTNFNDISIMSQVMKSIGGYGNIIISDKNDDLQNDIRNFNTLKSSGKRPHWRRGHFRTLPARQPHRLEEKLIWIKPTLVGTADAKQAKQSSYAATI